MSSRTDKKKRKYIILWEKIGIKLKKILKALVLILVIVQSIMILNINLLPMSMVMKLEGEAVVESYHYEPSGTIRIITEDSADKFKLKVYINGQLYKNKDKEFIELNVRNNDVIEIDGSDIKKDISLIIKYTSENVVFPKKGMRYNIENNIINIGRVKLK